MNYEKYYEPLVAVNSSDFNRCFYCGCEANHTDYIPPISFIHHWRDANSEAEFIAVPSCNECFDLLKKKTECRRCLSNTQKRNGNENT